jgi:hypothetical protein
MELGTDYKFRDDLFDAKKEGTTVAIELLVDPYQKVVYRYTTVTFKVDEDNIPRLIFDYEFIETGKFSMVKLRKDQYFQTVLGLILNAMLLEVEGTSETRTNDTEKSDQE